MTPVVSELADRAEITSLVSRYFSAIDDKRLDRATMEAVFTASGRLTTFCWSCDIARVGLALESARRVGGE
jgi:hypothetical protein